MTAGPLHGLAVLLAPPGDPAAVVVAPPDWTLPGALPEAGVVLWGRPPLPAGTSPRLAAHASLARVRSLARLQRQGVGGRRVRAVHRLQPPLLRLGPAARVREVLLRGAVAELPAGLAPDRVIDLVVAAAGVTAPLGRVRVGAGGTLLAQLPVQEGPAVLRAAPVGAPGDPAAAARALRTLAADPLTPTLHDAGSTAGASWTLEARLPGARPRALSTALVQQVATFAARLPVAGGRPSTAGDLELLADAVPGVSAQLAAVADRLDLALRGLPAVARHGDLWSGNLLVSGERLSGVVDWDAWGSAGVPGTDLLHLVATEERLRSRRSLGEVFLDRPWDWPLVRQADEHYWAPLGLRPTQEQRAAVGTAWWAAQLAGDLRRAPSLVEDQVWLQRNLSAVLPALPAG